MQANPTFSLITVCFNAANLLAETLQSAKEQSFKDFELVIIDGGSKDNTRDVLKPFESFIGTFISEPDKGIYDAMNKGIRAAKGKFVYFLNAGDAFYDNDVLAKIYACSQQTSADLIYAKVETKNEPTGINYIAGKPVVFKMFYSHYPICHQATFAKKSIFNKVGFFNLNYSLVADGEWFIRVFKDQTIETYFLDEIVAFYDIQGATYHKRMKGYREYIKVGFNHFPLFVAILNFFLYPIIFLKVWVIRNFQGTSCFKKYRALKFKNTLANAPL